MSSTYKLNGALYTDMVKCGAVNLRKNAQTVNELNVFPVPDGDTGENMARTIEGGVSALSGASENDIGKVAVTMARGMLLAARGNSGVILSQFFEGVKRGLEGHAEVDVAQLKTAFTRGVEQAYSAVVRPTEGTILTVMREASEKASTVDDSSTVEKYFSAFIDEMYASLDRTPDLLPVLRESGVIDSGGAGFVYIIEGMNSALHGDFSVMSPSGETAAAAVSDGGADGAHEDAFTPDSDMPFGYCTELIVQLMSGKCDPEKYDVQDLIKYLEGMGGESVVAFKTGTRIKLHVHTFEPDKVLAYCRSIGEFVSVKIENMSIQHSDNVVRNRFKRQTAESKHKKYACVTVADGEGLINQFRSLGADYVVDGKQTMNPSTQDFITAFDEVNADNIFVLPNNSNIMMAASQAASMYKKSNVIIVPSTTLAQGYSAISMLDYSCDDAEQIVAAFKEAINGVTTGQITYAIRDCELNGKKIKKGDFIGFADKALTACSDSIVKCANELLDKIDKTDKSVVIAIRGKDGADDPVIKAIGEHLKTVAPSIEFYDFDGGQDVYSIIFVVE